jgi:hypothetical protein
LEPLHYSVTVLYRFSLKDLHSHPLAFLCGSAKKALRPPDRSLHAPGSTCHFKRNAELLYRYFATPSKSDLHLFPASLIRLDIES